MKRILCMVCIFAMVIFLCNIAAFASETEEPIVITTAEQFVEQLVTNKATTYGRVFKIKGEDVLGKDVDGNDITGIDLTKYTKSFSITAFYGEIKGEPGYNGIKLKNTSLIGTIGGYAAKFENLILVGDDKAPKDNAGALFNSVLDPSSDASNSDITIKNVINYVNIDATKAGTINVGGLVGTVPKTTRNISFENCINYGNVTNNTAGGAGGIIGNASSGKVSIVNCHNYGIITSYSKAGGIMGNNAYNAADLITNCSNHGAVNCVATSGTNYGAAGIACSYIRIENSFNTGNITSTGAAGGIFGGYATINKATEGEKYHVKNCFNLGDVKSTAAETYCAGGIIGSYNATACVVQNCYNAGTVTSDETEAYNIGYSKNDSYIYWGNNYRTNPIADEETANGFDGIYITLADLSKGVPADFDTAKWEMVDDSIDFYSYPQLVNNTFYPEDKVTWVYVAPVTNAEFINTQSFSPEEVNDEDYEQYGDYSVVFTKINLTGIEDEEITEFGMYLLDANGNRLATAVGLAGNRIGGVFGILFYGNKFEDGVTYKAEPYIKAGDTEYKGTPVEFQIADAE